MARKFGLTFKSAAGKTISGAMEEEEKEVEEVVGQRATNGRSESWRNVDDAFSVVPRVFSACLVSGRTDYYGAIRNTQQQLFGRKLTKRVEELKKEAQDPNLVVREIRRKLPRCRMPNLRHPDPRRRRTPCCCPRSFSVGWRRRCCSG